MVRRTLTRLMCKRTITVKSIVGQTSLIIVQSTHSQPARFASSPHVPLSVLRLCLRLRHLSSSLILTRDHHLEVRKFTEPHTCLAPRMLTDHAKLDSIVIADYILYIIKKNSAA
ncbi:hypothetical protein PIB30_001051 [Stylosanthes scabra]|uniref:Uncharacterized protein n=1 Tax=Stylosanthes scabra TaxID=79078 RepID=A0ABU6T2B3_9FABA|nr:hypothetical protein [Stylosanthes scabra]